MKKLLLVPALVLCLAGAANAISFTLNPATIVAAGGIPVVIPGVDGSIFGSLTDPFGGTSVFDNPVQHLTVPTTWATWSHGYTGPVLFSQGLSSITMTFQSPVAAFGAFVEPNVLSIFNVTVGLSDGSSLSQPVDGNGGAAFFGFYNTSAAWVQFSTDPGAQGFAFSEMLQGPAAIPEPATLMLLGSGLLGMGGIRALRYRRKK